MMKYLYERKIKQNTNINVWLAYPAVKSFALSSLGYMFLCKSFDLMDNVRFEAIYTDTKRTEIMSKDVDIMGFSLIV